MKPVPLLGIALDVAMLCTDVHGISNLSNTISEINNGVLEKKNNGSIMMAWSLNVIK